MPHIITIGREFGSGGREVGRRLAERLGYAYYDDEIINELIRNTNYSKEYLEEVSEKDPVPLFPIRYGSTLNPTPDAGVSMALDVLSEQAKIMRELALKSDCIIIGRAADYLLRDLHPYRIFVFATLESRLARTKGREKSGKSDKELLKSIKRGRIGAIGPITICSSTPPSPTSNGSLTSSPTSSKGKRKRRKRPKPNPSSQKGNRRSLGGFCCPLI